MPPFKSAASVRHKRRRAERAGRWAEALAAFYLRLHLFRIRARRVRTPVGEIDLVATRNGLTLFVEVKARHSARLEGDALASVHTGRIVRAAEYFLARTPALYRTTVRFDVIFLAPWRWPRHVKGAFTAD